MKTAFWFNFLDFEDFFTRMELFIFATLGCLLMALCYVACCESVLHDIKDNMHDVTVNNYNVLY